MKINVILIIGIEQYDPILSQLVELYLFVEESPLAVV